MFMFNYIIDLTECFYHYYHTLNMITANTRQSYPRSITHTFLISLPTSQSITILCFIITFHLAFSHLGCTLYILIT